MSDYLTIAEFASIANVTTQAVYKRLDGSLKPYATVVNGKKVIHRKALELFETEKQQPEVANEPTDFKQAKATVDESLSSVVDGLQAENQQLLEMLTAEQQRNKELHDQVIRLSTDFAEVAKQTGELANQAHQLQGHFQKSALESPNESKKEERIGFFKKWLNK